MKDKDIIDAYARIRKIDHTIPDDVLDFMKDAALKALKETPRNNNEGFSLTIDDGFCAWKFKFKPKLGDVLSIEDIKEEIFEAFESPDDKGVCIKTYHS